MIEIRAREICPECKGTGHVNKGARFETCLACLRFGAHGYIEKWISIEDLNLSHDLTIAIREAFKKSAR